MDRGWDIPQSGSGAGSIDLESSYYQGSDDYQNWNPYPQDGNAMDNSADAFWGANPDAPMEEDTFAASQDHAFATDLKPGEVMNAKTAPTYDQANMTWFMFEEYVRDWEEITIVDKEKRGPVLRNRLKGYPATFKRIFDR